MNANIQMEAASTAVQILWEATSVVVDEAMS